MSNTGTAIIIPLYNGGRWIEQTLRSVQAQSRPAAKVIVVDDGSTDDSVEKVRQFSDITLLRNPEKGANAAREFGLAQTQATFVVMLDQDDLWHPEHLCRLENLAVEHPEAPAVSSGVIRFEGDAQPTLDIDSNAPRALDPWTTFPAAAIPTPSQVLMRRDALEAVGGWTRRFVGLADYHAWLRLSAQGPFWHAPQPTVGYRQHPNSHSAVLRRDQQNAFIIRLLAAAEDVLPTRARYFPENAELLSQRLKIARAMLSWLTALEEGKPESEAFAARRLNTEMVGQSGPVIEALWGQLFYLKSEPQIHASSATKARRIFRTYWKAPLTTPSLRSSLRRLVLRRVRETVQRSLQRSR